MGDIGSAGDPSPEVTEVIPVLIVGAGPAGLLMAHILHQQGGKE